MNKTFRLIWNEITCSWVAVSELTRSRSKRASLTLCRTVGVLSIMLGGNGLAFADALSSTQLPTGGQIVAGSGSISQSGANMTVNQTSSRMAANWQSFNIGSKASVTFNQPDSSSVALNRILSQDPTQILGRLSANGQVMLINPAGIVFGQGAQVNVGGIIASTLDISDQDFMAGNYTFTNTGSAGSIDNQGRITTGDGGIVALIAPIVSNQGSISTPNGSTLLASGDQILIDFTGDGLISYQMQAGTAKALVTNSGDISANGGLVVMTAKAADAVSQAVVNNTGLVQAQTLQSKQGRILLLSDMDTGTTEVGGTLDASAPASSNPEGGDGGFIETSAAHVTIAENAKITTHAVDGDSGNWLIDPVDFTIAATGGDMTGATLTSNLASGNVTIQSSSGGSGSNGDILVDDSVSWSSNTLTLDAYRNIEFNAEMNASGTAGLALKYGQGAVASGNTANYIVNAPINLAATGSFSTTLGSDGLAVEYTIIDSLGAANSTTGTDLQGINGGLSVNYVLGADIDASSTSSWDGGRGFNPIVLNYGTFDGLGHIISDLYIDRNDMAPVGLFSWANSSVIRNVGLVGGSVNGMNTVGGLVGGASDGSITNAFATISVIGVQDVGGLVGYMSDGTISRANYTGSVIGQGDYIGGIVGRNNSSALSDVYAAGSVTGSHLVGGLVGSNYYGTIVTAYATNSVSGDYYVGGLVGKTQGGTITNSYASGNVSGGFAVGGLVGDSRGYGTLNNVYASGNVTGNTTVGGLVGYDYTGNVINGYAYGSVTGSNIVGGLVGHLYGWITDAYSTGRVTGNSNVGGFIGLQSDRGIVNGYWDTATSGTNVGVGYGSTDGVTGLASIETLNLPSGFSPSVWGIDSSVNSGYPYLLSQVSASSTSTNTGSNTNTDTGSNTDTDTSTNTNTDTGSNTGTDTSSNTNTDTSPSPSSDTNANSNNESGLISLCDGGCQTVLPNEPNTGEESRDFVEYLSDDSGANKTGVGALVDTSAIDSYQSDEVSQDHPSGNEWIYSDEYFDRFVTDPQAAISDLTLKLMEAGIDAEQSKIASQFVGMALSMMDHQALKTFFGPGFASSMRGGLKNFVDSLAKDLAKPTGVKGIKDFGMGVVENLAVDTLLNAVFGAEYTDKANIGQMYLNLARDVVKTAILSSFDTIQSGKSPTQAALVFQVSFTTGMGQVAVQRSIEAFQAAAGYSQAQKGVITSIASGITTYAISIQQADVQEKIGNHQVANNKKGIAENLISSISSTNGEHFGLSDLRPVNILIGEALMAKQNGDDVVAANKIDEARKLANQQDGVLKRLKNLLPGEYSHSAYVAGVTQALGF